MLDQHIVGPLQPVDKYREYRALDGGARLWYEVFWAAIRPAGIDRRLVMEMIRQPLSQSLQENLQELKKREREDASLAQQAKAEDEISLSEGNRHSRRKQAKLARQIESLESHISLREKQGA